MNVRAVVYCRAVFKEIQREMVRIPLIVIAQSGDCDHAFDRS
jgi:hypothetical protein